MPDPPRLRGYAGSVEALLLESSSTCEPPPFAEDQVWRRIQGITAAGVAIGATGLGVRTATAGANFAKGALSLSVLKWSAVVALAIPVGAVAHWAGHRESTHGAPNIDTAVAVDPAAGADVVPSTSAQAASPLVVPSGLKPTASPRLRGDNGATTEASSALRRESLSLGAARAQFAAGNPGGALDEVARLSVEFPHGRLVQEREVLAMDSLAVLGEREAARTRARAFLDRFPASPYEAHVRQIAAR